MHFPNQKIPVKKQARKILDFPALSSIQLNKNTCGKKLIYKIAEELHDRIKCSGIIISVSIIFGVDIFNILYDMLSHK